MAHVHQDSSGPGPELDSPQTTRASSFTFAASDLRNELGRGATPPPTAPAPRPPAPLAPRRRSPSKIHGSGRDTRRYNDSCLPTDSSDQDPKNGIQPNAQLFPPDPQPWATRSFSYQYRPFRGMVSDVKRRWPFYWSDWTDGIMVPKHWERVIGATIRMYFLNLMPAIAYILDMNVRTDGNYGLNEALLASAVAALTFSTVGVQPLTIVGVTGLINLFNYTTFDIIKDQGIDYLQFQAWTLIWAAILHWIVAIFNVTDYSRFITDITSETFGLYVGVIYVQKGVELLIYEFDVSGSAGWFSVVVATVFALFVYFLERIGTQGFGPFWFRKGLMDYSFAMAIVAFTGVVHIPGQIKNAGIEFLPITASFRPSTDRGWIIPFWHLPIKWIFASLPFGFLVLLLFYFDNNVSSLNAQSRGFPIKKPAGFHWDFFLLGVTTLISGILGLPAPNGLVPQAPVHTESLCVLELVPEDVKLSEGGYLMEETHESDASAEKYRKIVNQAGASNGSVKSDDERILRYRGKEKTGRGEKSAKSALSSRDKKEGKRLMAVRTRVIEQRVTHFLMGLLILGTMSRPLLVVLGLMSKAMFAGVFIVVGWGSIEGNGIVHKTLYLLRDRRLTPRDHPLFKVKRTSIAKYIGIQWFVFTSILTISETIVGIGFPVLITLLIPFWYYYGPRILTAEELAVLDAPTANSEAVLVSLGGLLPSSTLGQDQPHSAIAEDRTVSDEENLSGEKVEKSYNPQVGREESGCDEVEKAERPLGTMRRRASLGSGPPGTSADAYKVG